MFILLASYGYFGYLHDIVISQKKYDSVVKVEKDISEPFTENDQTVYSAAKDSGE